jgi:hypothetical protein
MKPPFLHWLICIGALAGSLVGIGLLQASDARAAPVAPPKDSRLECIPNEHTLCIQYVDFHNLSHRFSCQVDPRLAREAEDSFGYPLEGEMIQKELDRRLIIEIKRQAKLIDPSIVPYISVGIERHSAAPRSEAPVFWRYKHPLSLKDNLPIQLRAEALEVQRKLKVHLNGAKQRIYDEYYAERGFRKGPLFDDKGRPEYGITYKRIADQARPLLTDCFAELARQAGVGDDQEVMELLSALFQEMPFELPKNEQDLYKSDFREPIAVLRRGLGDCDSKSVALSSLWRSPGPQMILLFADLTEKEKASVPLELRASQHAFIGYESNAGRGTVRAGVLHYVLYEASRALDPAAEKLLPGKVLVSSPPLRGICLTDDCCGLDQSNCRIYEDAPDDR